MVTVADKKTVVVTGASSGIGRASVSRMVQAGWQVFATVRKVQDGEQLCSDFGTDVVPVIMDLTDRPSIATAAEQVNSCWVVGG